MASRKDVASTTQPSITAQSFAAPPIVLFDFLGKHDPGLTINAAAISEAFIFMPSSAWSEDTTAIRARLRKKWREGIAVQF